MFGSIFWIIYGILTFIAFIIISLVDDFPNENLLGFVDDFTIMAFLLRLIVAILWLPLLIIFFVILSIDKIKERK